MPAAPVTKSSRATEPSLIASLSRSEGRLPPQPPISSPFTANMSVTAVRATGAASRWAAPADGTGATEVVTGTPSETLQKQG